ncbi:MAG: cytochrome c [Acidobacteria bacterium]|nr:cytochrome c [Acidobacteriota bacterium]MBI3469979.1 cytochrome c [Candidatus Solibacter usitatus]
MNRFNVRLLVAAILPALGGAQEAAEFFRQNCVSCHTIGGGRLTGPDLKDVGQRKDPAWLTRFLMNPQGMINSGDAYALQLQQQARGVVMPTVQGMNKARAEALLGLIEAESKLEKSQFIGLQISDRPFTGEDIEQGRRMFRGTRKLLNGGPPCISCHTMKDLGGLGGGRLAPDLTRVFERLEGRKNLASWLFAPATPTMQPIFRKHPLDANEALLLVALFEDSAKRGGQDDSVALLNFFFLALGGAVIGLAACDAAWKRRFRAVRRPLVRGMELTR